MLNIFSIFLPSTDTADLLTLHLESNHSRMKARFERVLLNSYHTRKTSALHKRTTESSSTQKTPKQPTKKTPQRARTGERKVIPEACVHYDLGTCISPQALGIQPPSPPSLSTNTPWFQSPLPLCCCFPTFP